MNKTRKHLFHILNPSPWPIFTSIGIFFLVSTLTFLMHNSINTIQALFYLNLLYCISINWLNDIVDESTIKGDHTLVVQIGLTYGFLLFLVSEIMLFFGFFFAFFSSALSPSILIGAQFPPIGMIVIPFNLVPLYNTSLLLLSGITVTWLHKAIILGSYKDSIDSFFLTIFLGFTFFLLQIGEYYESVFSYNTSVYACVFFMLTGLHGFHVFVGLCCLFICFIRLLNNHFTKKHHNALIFAIWYWHFVDIVWLFLFITVYCWGNAIYI